jgi:hypothetical protein
MSRRRLRSGGRSASAWEFVALIGYNTMKKHEQRVAHPATRLQFSLSYSDRMECHRKNRGVT